MNYDLVLNTDQHIILPDSNIFHRYNGGIKTQYTSEENLRNGMDVVLYTT